MSIIPTARKLTRNNNLYKTQIQYESHKESNTEVKHANIRQAGLTVLNDFKNKVYQLKTGCKNTVDAIPAILIAFRTVENGQDFISFVYSLLCSSMRKFA